MDRDNLLTLCESLGLERIEGLPETVWSNRYYVEGNVIYLGSGAKGHAEFYAAFEFDDEGKAVRHWIREDSP